MHTSSYTIHIVHPDITYRLLDKSEWARLEPIFRAQHGVMPSAELANVAIAEERGEIVGMLVLQIIPHMEPLWASNPRVDVRALTHQLEVLLPPGATAYTSAPNDHIAGLAKAAGFHETGDRVLAKSYDSAVH